MPGTYSIFQNTIYNADRIDNIQGILYKLPDNENKEINPKDLRDSIYSLWENSVFKIVSISYSNSNINYIGIDDDNPNYYSNTFTGKILFGKRNILSNNVLDNNLLNSDTDIYFFNNKSDSNLSLQDTKVSILAGTNNVLHNNSPYLKSRISIGPTLSQIIQFDISNKSGDINISSLNSVEINNIKFPSISETIASASNGSILLYDSSNNKLYWHLNSFFTSSVNNPSSSVSIYGNPITVNGYNLELNDNRPIISEINSIKLNKTFTNQSIVEVVREMLYKYIPPSCSLEVNSTIFEKGDPNINIKIKWTIYKRTDPIISAIFTSGNVINFTSPAPINTPGSHIITSSTYSKGIPPSNFIANYIFSVTDSGESNNNTPTTVTASVSVKLVYPYFYGINSIDASNVSLVNSILPFLKKDVSDKSNKEVTLLGNGYVYFLYPVSCDGLNYGTLSAIIDENGMNVYSYTYSIYSSPGLTSPNYYWSNISYYVYKIGPVSYNNPVVWKFMY